ncbi:MAG: hypothetical protein O7B35_01255 [Deltaproteobacteria bacterium]|nr:hypothetical protein [Deltaproteobacteria bacterium]
MFSARISRAKIGEMMMRLELAEGLIEKKGFAEEWRRRENEKAPDKSGA